MVKSSPLYPFSGGTTSKNALSPDIKVYKKNSCMCYKQAHALKLYGSCTGRVKIRSSLHRNVGILQLKYTPISSFLCPKTLISSEGSEKYISTMQNKLPTIKKKKIDHSTMSYFIWISINPSIFYNRLSQLSLG